LFKRESEDDAFETSDFALTELNLAPGTLSALAHDGYNTFLQIIDFDRAAFLAIEGLGEAEADHLLTLIDELTVVAEDFPKVAGAAEVPEAAEVEGATETGVEDAAEVEEAAEAEEGDARKGADEGEIQAEADAGAAEAQDAEGEEAGLARR
jgi:hypothetical protein